MDEILRLKSEAIAAIQNVLLKMDQDIHDINEKIRFAATASPKDALSMILIPHLDLVVQTRLVKIDRALENIRAEVKQALGG